MCNIAGYVGNRAAAPILLEMLRRQQDYDGGMCTGIATIHEGRLYYRKIVGDVDALIKHTDALYLPGTIGIAHTRPGGKNDSYVMAHPFITPDETMAGVTNGTGISIGDVSARSRSLAAMLEDAGYKFRGEVFEKNGLADYQITSVEANADEMRVPTKRNMPVLKNGANTSGAEIRTNAVHYYYNQGMRMTAAMSKVDSYLYKDGVLEMLNVATPDKIYVLRTTRPAATLKTEDGIYIATTRFAFPDGLPGEYQQLPVMYPCEITKDNIKIVTEDKMEGEEISEITPEVFEDGYNRIVAMLEGKENEPLYFDDLELAIARGMTDIFPGNHPLFQHARLVYDVLWRLTEEGRLKTERRWFKNEKFRTFMWI